MTSVRTVEARYARAALLRQRAVNLALALVLALSAFLMATGAMVLERLVGSIDALFSAARPPHFLQMHTGDYDEAAVARFAASRPDVQAWLIQPIVNVDGTQLTWTRPGTTERGDLSSSVVQNLFVPQNDGFDLLLDATGPAHPGPGEVCLPIAYEQRFGLRAGDVLSVRTSGGAQEFTVAGFCRDAQMASSLSSAARLLVNRADFDRLAAAGAGTSEIIVEFRCFAENQADALQSAYAADPGLPKQGQAITYPMIRMINAISDGLVALVLMLVSVLLIVIALLNLRFVIAGALTDDVRQIGAMKAIGLSDRDIAALYLTRFRALALVGCSIGGVASVAGTRALIGGIQRSYAAAPFTWLTLAAPLAALAAVYLIVLLMCRGSLRAIRRVQVVSAMVHGSTLTERQEARSRRRLAAVARRFDLATTRLRNLNRVLALHDLRTEWRRWILLPAVFFLAAVIMITPTNLYSTFSSPHFVTYMGAPEAALRSDILFRPDADAIRSDLEAALHADPRIRDVRTFADVRYEARAGDGQWESTTVEVGDYSGTTIAFVRGRAPRGVDEIAVSVLNARKFGLDVGSVFTLSRAGQTRDLTVSGVYQDVTNGGYTAKLPGNVTTGADGYVSYADLTPGTDPVSVAATLNQRVPDAKTIAMREFVSQTLSYVTGAFVNAAVIAVAFALGVAALITTLFLKLQLARDRGRIATLAALGFSGAEVAGQYRLKVLLMAAGGIVLGALFAATAGQAGLGIVVSASGLGLSQLTFIPNPLLVDLLYPVALMGVASAAATALTIGLGAADKSAWLKG